MATAPANHGGLPETFCPGFHDEAAVRRMPYRQFGDRSVSIISYGASALGGVFRSDTSLEESIAVVHTALKRGINLLDTAPWYGHGVSETVSPASEGVGDTQGGRGLARLFALMGAFLWHTHRCSARRWWACPGRRTTCTPRLGATSPRRPRCLTSRSSGRCSP